MIGDVGSRAAEFGRDRGADLVPADLRHASSPLYAIYATPAASTAMPRCQKCVSAVDVGGREQGIAPAPVGDQLGALRHGRDKSADVQGKTQRQIRLGIIRKRIDVRPGE